MYKQTHNQTQAFRFRRYCRAAYAAFNSLHREVTIGCVATYIADRQLRKSVAVAAVAVVLAHGTAMAQADEERETRTLPEVQVMMAADSLFGTPEPAAVFTAEDLQHSSVRTVGDILALLPAVDVRTRGVGDVQADLSVHGGTFDQMVVMLNGINISDAQTGHHNMDLPVDVSMVERVELLTPSQMMARGVVAFSGGVNIVVCEEYRERLLAEVSGGNYGTANAALLATWRAGQWALTAAGSYHCSDGYMHNTDYRHGSLFLQAHRHAGDAVPLDGDEGEVQQHRREVEQHDDCEQRVFSLKHYTSSPSVFSDWPGTKPASAAAFINSSRKRTPPFRHRP